MGVTTVAPGCAKAEGKIAMFARLRLAALALAFAAPSYAQAPQSLPSTPAMPPPVTNAVPGIMKPTPPKSPTMAPAPTPAAITASPASAAGRIDINSASVQQLDGLFGIGEARAKKIVAGRPYASLEELVKKKALTQAVFDKAKPRMALANINTSSAKDLEKTLPGIGDVRSKAIVAGRPYATTADLVTKGVLTSSQFEAIAGLISN